MTDNDIIKALECCRKHNSCDGCPMHTMNCTARVPMAFAVDLINRQKAEIDSLRNVIAESTICVDRLDRLFKMKCNELENTEIIRDSVFEEFVKKVDEMTTHTIDDEYVIWKCNFNDIVKEMKDKIKW